MRRGSLPMRHGGSLFGLFRAKWSFLPSHVALEVQCDVAGDFLPFSELKEGFFRNHVALEAQYDVAPVQHDVAGAFSPFSEPKEGVLPQPCRVGGPMRRGARPPHP